MLPRVVRRLISGYATPEGTARYSQRVSTIAENHFSKTSDGLSLSSIGVGTYIGDLADSTDTLVESAVKTCVLSGGINMLDTAINYRYQKAERSIGRAIASLVSDGSVQRDELFVASKAGYLTEDADNGVPSYTLVNALKAAGTITDEDVVGKVHCMHPAYLSDQLDKSRENLGLDTIDLYYLHNAAESQMPLIGQEAFNGRLQTAMEFLESAREQNKIRSYGLATWICFRSPPTETDIFLSLEKVIDMARQVGGDNHGLQYIQLPINLMMPEAFVQPWCTLKGEEDIFLNVAADLGVNIVISQPLLQAQINQIDLSKHFPTISDRGAQHLQIIRSLPSSAILSTLVGMKSAHTVKENLKLISEPKLTKDEFWRVLKPEGAEEQEIVIDLK